MDDPAWQAEYARRLAVSDTMIIVGTIFGTQFAWLGIGDVTVFGASFLDYTTVSIVCAAGWLAGLVALRSRAASILGYGPHEYRIIVDCTLRVFGVIAMVSYLCGLEISRGYILISLPLGVVLLLINRRLWRLWLKAERKRGRMIARVMLVGPDEANRRIAAELHRLPEAGYRVVGACSVDDPDGEGDSALPIVGSLNDIPGALQKSEATTVIVSGESGLTALDIRRLCWELEGTGMQFIMAPNIIDVVATRVRSQPVAGLSLVHVEIPGYSRRHARLKRGFDMIVSASLLVLLAPVIAVIACAVVISGGRPIFFHQQRIGLYGKPFRMIKFRSMVDGADRHLQRILAEQGGGDTPLFKPAGDPRVTPLGRILRKFSLDELPQLINVLAGDMSLVGPRPQREGEVALYDQAARRRLIVKPGMSGLWQVSGRSSLSWEDALRLDLYYVENWSLTGDIGILLRTFRVVMAPGETAR
ncbi:sugar transferase [Microbacterium sp. E-13]|uniref:sugar transferase n=1 Tax=Microbacterium sp. E-13 TaxID=3404048 RepID=UPI003CF31EC5